MKEIKFCEIIKINELSYLSKNDIRELPCAKSTGRLDTPYKNLRNSSLRQRPQGVLVFSLKKILIVSLSVFLLASVGNIGIYQVEASSAPAGIVYSVPITLTNTQSAATPIPFQQMITMNSAAYASYEAPNLQNVEFYNSNGAVIPSWLESGNSNTSTNTIYWLKLVNGIPANSSVTVNMGFASPSTNLLSTQTTGEAPQLSSTYGEYDNGDNIFQVYYNFEGIGTLSGLTLSNGTMSFNDGVFLTPPITGYTYLQTASKYRIPLIIESFGKANSSNCYPGVEYNSSGDQFYGVGNNAQYYILSPPDTIHGSFNYGTYYVFGMAVTPSLIVGYSNYIQIATQSASPAASGGVGLAFGTYPGQDYSFFYWMRTRAYPPNGIMPGVNVTATLSRTPAQAGSSSTPATSKSSSFIIIIVAVIALVVIAGVLALLLVRRKKSKKGPSATELIKETAARNAPKAKTKGMETSNPADRLQRLKVMLDKGLITQQDYDEQKKKILEEYTK